jgi:hypothetical protein
MGTFISGRSGQCGIGLPVCKQTAIAAMCQWLKVEEAGFTNAAAPLYT